jgi:tRNA (cytidine/uridine-2'-O-)-methyltransferase
MKELLNILVVAPEIPPNTGNIIRLCSNSGCNLHLIKPIGFNFDNKSLKRARLDYNHNCNISIYESFDEYIKTNNPDIVYATSTSSNTMYNEVNYHFGDTIMFGSESVGLPSQILNKIPKKHILKIPMVPQNRSINLSNAVSIVVYEAWRQLEYFGSSTIKQQEYYN